MMLVLLSEFINIIPLLGAKSAVFSLMGSSSFHVSIPDL
ncbi:hypothetical protein DFP95_12813 [Cohnella lupini]|uniref:Uncharacterized protein n=1 Tax=Cohnella lupini TaxID=1294267 RepID=A0A3D9HU19_9BACL|nr:hypothetical protein DFP95_12813 [Cohnella lupini]